MLLQGSYMVMKEITNRLRIVNRIVDRRIEFSLVARPMIEEKLGNKHASAFLRHFLGNQIRVAQSVAMGEMGDLLLQPVDALEKSLVVLISGHNRL
jgi:hypothetical protein